MEFRGEQEAFPSATWERGKSDGTDPFTLLRLPLRQAQGSLRMTFLRRAEVAEALGIDGVMGEELRHGRHRDVEVAGADFAEDIPKVGGDGEVAFLEKFVGREGGPVAVDFAALDRAAQGEEAGAVAVIGAAVAVLVHGAP